MKYESERQNIADSSGRTEQDSFTTELLFCNWCWKTKVTTQFHFIHSILMLHMLTLQMLFKHLSFEIYPNSVVHNDV